MYGYSFPSVSKVCVCPPRGAEEVRMRIRAASAGPLRHPLHRVSAFRPGSRPLAGRPPTSLASIDPAMVHCGTVRSAVHAEDCRPIRPSRAGPSPSPRRLSREGRTFIHSQGDAACRPRGRSSCACKVPYVERVDRADRGDMGHRSIHPIVMRMQGPVCREGGSSGSWRYGAPLPDVPAAAAAAVLWDACFPHARGTGERAP